MDIKKHIPNLLTLLNLLSGCIAMVMVADLKFDMAFYFVALGIFFDFFDGYFARKFNVSGPLGLQLDSLADMVTSGVVPGFVMFCMLSFGDFSTNYFLPYLGFVITLGACYRLGNFNIDARQSDSFIGLPTPANTLFIVSLPLISNSIVASYINNQWVLLGITAISAYIMNAEIPLFSLKIKDFSFHKYKLQMGFLIASITMVISLKFLAVPLIILTYVLLSILNTFFAKKVV